MNQIEGFQTLVEGGRIRNKRWEKGCFREFDDKGQLHYYDNKGKKIMYEMGFEYKCDLTEDWWELYGDKLNFEEKEYLEKVLKPFKDNIEYVTKSRNGVNFEKLKVRMIGETDDYMYFPSFENGAMYKDMGINEEYTLEELGLFQEE